METKCIVKDCKNTSAEMVFYGTLCAQCHVFLAEGAGETSQAYRNMLKTLILKLYNVLKRIDSEFKEPPVTKPARKSTGVRRKRTPPVTYTEVK